MSIFCLISSGLLLCFACKIFSYLFTFFSCSHVCYFITHIFLFVYIYHTTYIYLLKTFLSSCSFYCHLLFICLHLPLFTSNICITQFHLRTVKPCLLFVYNTMLLFVYIVYYLLTFDFSAIQA